MKTLKGLYQEEVEVVLDNMQRNSQVTIKKESGNQVSFSVTFENEVLYKKIEDLLYFSQKDYNYDNDNSFKYSSYEIDDDDDN